MNSTLTYRPCAGIMVLNRSGLVWIGRRFGAPNEPEGPGSWWQMPQGGIDPDEDPRAAALRELYEETGIRSVEIIAESPDWYVYDLPEQLRPKAWGGRFRGQRQKWFAMRFLGSDERGLVRLVVAIDAAAQLVHAGRVDVEADGAWEVPRASERDRQAHVAEPDDGDALGGHATFSVFVISCAASCGLFGI